VRASLSTVAQRCIANVLLLITSLRTWSTENTAVTLHFSAGLPKWRLWHRSSDSEEWTAAGSTWVQITRLVLGILFSTTIDYRCTGKVVDYRCPQSRYMLDSCESSERIVTQFPQAASEVKFDWQPVLCICCNLLNCPSDLNLIIRDPTLSRDFYCFISR